MSEAKLYKAKRRRWTIEEGFFDEPGKAKSSTMHMAIEGVSLPYMKYTHARRIAELLRKTFAAEDRLLTRQHVEFEDGNYVRIEPSYDGTSVSIKNKLGGAWLFDEAEALTMAGDLVAPLAEARAA